MEDFSGRTILITGGTGSFGYAVAKALLATKCTEVRIFSRDEKKQEDMRRAFSDPRLKFFIGDVRDIASLETVTNSIDYLFHAAALKQVPSCEFFPIEAIKTNVIGTDNVIRSAIRARAKSVVILSTDKAVMPVNAMGLSKALMEKVAQAEMRAASASAPIVSCVRYGNVMFSRGSVIPLFIKQILSNAEITITDPRMTRFMLTMPEAVDLVLFALKKARPGDIFVRKSSAARIGLLADVLQKLLGKRGRVRQIGIRHGEKMHETLASAAELSHAEDLGDFYRIPIDARDLNYDIYFDVGEPVSSDAFTSDNTVQLSERQLEQLLTSLPEFQSLAAISANPLFAPSGEDPFLLSWLANT